MRDILYPETPLTDPNPMRRAQAAMARQVLPKRFYKDVQVSEIEGRYAIHLDSRPAKTPRRNLLALPTPAAAEVLAAEWRAQETVVDPALMHATRITNTAIDSIGECKSEVQADVARYAGSDLVCYRAEEPEGLVAAQCAAWDPVVDWASRSLNAPVLLARGIIHRTQPEKAMAAIAAVVATEVDPIRLAALHVLTTMSGSCLIALMLRAQAIDPASAFAAATIDEAWNAELWGRDADAEAREARRLDEFMAAAALLAAIPG